MTAIRYGDVKVGQKYWLEDGDGPYARILTDEDLADYEDFPAILDERVFVKTGCQKCGGAGEVQYGRTLRRCPACK